MNTLYRKLSLGLLTLALTAVCLGGDDGADLTRKVNEYEGQHRIGRVNEYEGQHLAQSGDPSQWG